MINQLKQHFDPMHLTPFHHLPPISFMANRNSHYDKPSFNLC